MHADAPVVFARVLYKVWLVVVAVSGGALDATFEVQVHVIHDLLHEWVH